MGGEKRWCIECILAARGSPPRGRGKDAPQGTPYQPTRITPAWAGKSLPLLLRSHSGRDHPRVGGEKAMVCEMVRFVWGSPPRGRGKGVLLHPA